MGINQESDQEERVELFPTKKKKAWTWKIWEKRRIWHEKSSLLVFLFFLF